MFVKCLSEGHNEYHSIDVTENRTRSKRLKIAIRKASEKDPLTFAAKAFDYKHGFRVLQKIKKKNNMFYEEEWIKFFRDLAYMATVFVNTTGSLWFFILILPCFKKIKKRVKSIEAKYGILIKMMFTLFYFSNDVKFMWGHNTDILALAIYEIQGFFQRFIRNEMFDQRAIEMFDQAFNLTYAVYYNNIGRPELTKIRLQPFFEEYGERIYSNRLPYTRSFMIGLNFYQMAIAFEEDVEKWDDKKKP